MRIRMMADGRVLEGTAKQIAEAMHALAFGQESRSLPGFKVRDQWRFRRTDIDAWNNGQIRAGRRDDMPAGDGEDS